MKENYADNNTYNIVSCKWKIQTIKESQSDLSLYKWCYPAIKQYENKRFSEKETGGSLVGEYAFKILM